MNFKTRKPLVAAERYGQVKTTKAGLRKPKG